MSKLRIGYICEYNLKLNPQLTDRFEYKEAPYTQSISSRGNKIKSKLLSCSVDYDDVKRNTDTMKQYDGIVVVREPFFVDDELRERVLKWVEWANKADQADYDPFADREVFQ